MVYELGGTIEASDYNTLIVEINRLFDNGTGNFGYGGGSINVPETILTSIAAGDEIDNQQWLDLRNVFADCAEHQGTILPDGLPSIADIEDGDPAAFFSKLASSANLLALSTNRFNINPSFVPVIIPSPNGVNSVRTLPWSQFIEHSFTITFQNSDHARHFFNAGGYFTLDASRTGGTVSPQNEAWDKILFELGAFTFDRNQYYSLTGGLTQVRASLDIDFSGSLYSSIGPYAISNYWTISAQRVGAQGANGGNGSKIKIVSSFLDNNTNAPDVVDGTFTSSVTEVKYSDVFDIDSPTYSTIIDLSNGL